MTSACKGGKRIVLVENFVQSASTEHVVDSLGVASQFFQLFVR